MNNRAQTNTAKNMQEKAGSQFQNTAKCHQPVYHSRLHCCGKIFDEKSHYSKYGQKENWTNTGKNKQEKAGSQSHNISCHWPPFQI